VLRTRRTAQQLCDAQKLFTVLCQSFHSLSVRQPTKHRCAGYTSHFLVAIVPLSCGEWHNSKHT